MGVKAQYHHNIGLKFMGLSIHPKGAYGNEVLMPHKLDKHAYLVMNWGAMLAYERFFFGKFLSIKMVQGFYADCAAQFAGFTSIGIRVRIFKLGCHQLYGGMGPTVLYRRNWFRLAGYKDTHYFQGGREDFWQYKLLWYGGELEYRYALCERMDISTTFVPGYPDLLCLSFGFTYNF